MEFMASTLPRKTAEIIAPEGESGSPERVIFSGRQAVTRLHDAVLVHPDHDLGRKARALTHQREITFPEPEISSLILGSPE